MITDNIFDKSIDSENTTTSQLIEESIDSSSTDSRMSKNKNKNIKEKNIKEKNIKEKNIKEKNQMNEDKSKDVETETEEELVLKDETLDSMKKNYSYPDPSDPSIQYILYKKRETYGNSIPARPQIDKDTDYSVIKEYRENVCARKFTLHKHQNMLSNLINPDTPYRGILVFHGLGSGKCVARGTNIFINNQYRPINVLWDLYKTEIIVDHHGGEWSIPSRELIVQSYNNRGQFEMKRLVHLYREYIDDFVRKIVLEDGRIILITYQHKLLTTSGWRNNFVIGESVGVLPENNISEDDKIIFIRIISIDAIPYTDYVYDIEVEDNHNYIANGILSHNTCVGVAIAEKFKEMVVKYNTKIYILVPGPILKENWKNFLLFCTGETYMKYQDRYTHVDEAEKTRIKKQALAQALQYYKIMSYRSFYKRVLGEKIVDRKESAGSKSRTTYRKTEEGEFERDIAIDRIYNMNNSVIIVDEAHNLTGNAYGAALDKIIKNSINLKTILMSATPMKNLGSDIVELINFLRPADAPMDRDLVFNQHKNHMMDFKQDGMQYFKNMVNGYVSHVRGSDPLTFAKREDRGEIPTGLQFTNVTRCQMLPFQRKTYDSAIREVEEDALDRKSEAVANFAFPGLSADRKSIVGYYGREGLNVIRDQIRGSQDLLNKKIAEKFFNGKEGNYLYLTPNGKSISGKIFQMPYLKHFSVKFNKALKKIKRLVAGKKGARTAFVYSNLVKVGIELFRMVLLQNGYIEFEEDQSNYQIEPSTICYYCGKKYKDHTSMNRSYNQATQLTGKEMADGEWKYSGGGKKNNPDNETDESTDTDDEYEAINQDIKQSDSSTEYESKSKSVVNVHKFYPATFVCITGKSSEEKAEVIPEDKKRILDKYFNNIENKEGKYLKLVLGSKVMNEGVSMSNVGEVHVLDVYFNLGKVDQVIGRAIRWCSHYQLYGKDNVFPSVKVYKYVISLGKNGVITLSSEEDLYRKAELKYLLIKRLERAMKERAFDCPLNINGNIFNEEIKEFDGCEKKGDMKCPNICDYQKCYYKCDDPKLNLEYYDPNRKVYKILKKNELDYSTFTHALAESEIEYAKDKIKEMYILQPVYTLQEINEYVRNSYDKDHHDLFDEFFVYKALDDLIPVTENDFNNLKDTIIDRNNTQGYLIYRNKYYIFQPFNQNEDVPMIYRVEKDNTMINELSLFNYMRNNDKYKKIRSDKKKSDTRDKIFTTHHYNFDETMEYYDDRDEFDFVGIIDKELSRRKSKKPEEMMDVFKIRESLPKVLDKKRGTGIPSLKGAVCSTSKSRDYLEKIANKLGIEIPKEMIRTDICENIKENMLLKEKYATDATKDKFTYMRIPSNHPKYKFPYNLEDRVKYIVQKIRQTVKHSLNIRTNKIIKPTGPEKGMPSYEIIIDRNDKLAEYDEILKKMGAEIKGKQWIVMLE